MLTISTNIYAASTGYGLPAGIINTTKLATDAVTTVKVLNGAIDTTKLGTDAVTTVKVLNAAIDSTKLATDSVITAKILNGNVTTIKLADSAVDTSKLATDSVSNPKILNGAVDTLKLAQDAIDTTKVKTDSVTGVKILNGTIDTAKLNATIQAQLAGNFTGSVYVGGDEDISGGLEVIGNINGYADIIGSDDLDITDDASIGDKLGVGMPRTGICSTCTLSVNGNIAALGGIQVGGTSTATYYYGNGAYLTGIAAGAAVQTSSVAYMLNNWTGTNTAMGGNNAISTITLTTSNIAVDLFGQFTYTGGISQIVCVGVLIDGAWFDFEKTNLGLACWRPSSASNTANAHHWRYRTMTALSAGSHSFALVPFTDVGTWQVNCAAANTLATPGSVCQWGVQEAPH